VKKGSRKPRPPRVSSELRASRPPSEDDRTWDGVKVVGGTGLTASYDDLEIIGSHLIGVQLVGVEHHRLRMLDVILDDCDVSGAVLTEATFLRVEFNRCRLSGFMAAGSTAQDVSWSDSKLDSGNFRAATIERCEWRDCVMSEADFYAARLTASSLYGCDLTGAEFSKARCERVNLHGSNLHEVRGADALVGCTISSDQIAVLAPAVLGAIGIAVSDDDPDAPDR
jgi:pentapeptide repeat protein